VEAALESAVGLVADLLRPGGWLGQVLRWGGCYAAGVAIGWLIWIPGIDDYPYYWELRLGSSLGLVFASGVIVNKGGAHRWRAPVLAAGLAGVLTPPAVAFFSLIHAGPNWAS
jgi:hypothetical protein